MPDLSPGAISHQDDGPRDAFFWHVIVLEANIGRYGLHSAHGTLARENLYGTIEGSFIGAIEMLDEDMIYANRPPEIWPEAVGNPIASQIFDVMRDKGIYSQCAHRTALCVELWNGIRNKLCACLMDDLGVATNPLFELSVDDA